MKMHEIDEDQFNKLIEAHREEEDECRWCFAVDLHRVKTTLIAKYDFPDAMVLHFKCPRCEGEFSRYIHMWGEDYIRARIAKVHPDWAENVDDYQIQEINDRMWPDMYC